MVLNKLTREIYGLCLEQESLPQLLADLAAYLHCQSVGIQVIDKLDFHVVAGLAQDMSEQNAHLYAEHFASLKPYLPKLSDIERQTHAGSL